MATAERIGEDGVVLSDDERRAIDTLKRLTRRWPRTLMLASMGGSLHVLRLREDGDHPMRADDRTAIDPDAIVCSLPHIPNTGGDW